MAAQDKMDMRNWKKVLLQWVVECGFTERNYFNIEQSDVDLFFEKFRQHHSGASTHENINDFLKDVYPDFEPHVDDDNELSSTDYIYVYSLILHFSCVKQPVAHFQEICQRLSSYCQQSITEFLKGLLKVQLDKEHLRQAIAHASTIETNTVSSSESSNSSSKGSISGCNNKNIKNILSLGGVAPLEGSAMKTPPRQRNDAKRTSPSTPKTVLLEERTRDLYNLRAQLETERYEKGLLEVEIKQNEDKMLKLNEDYKKLQQQIKDLKNDICKSRADNNTPHCAESESQIKRRMCKEINQKEEEISNLTDLLNSSKEEKCLINEKLFYAQKQIIVCMERIKEFDYKVDELNAELEQKDTTIQCLQENKKDLEHFINEMRLASRPQLDSSVEFLDASFTRDTNSSSSMGSPENLGCSVIDVQLREKQLENAQLREEIAVLNVNNTRLSKMIQQCTRELCDEFTLQYEDDPDDIETDNDLTSYFVAYNKYIDKLGKFYKNERNTTTILRDDIENLQHQHGDLYNRIKHFEQEVKDLKSNVERLAEHNVELERNKKDMILQISQHNNEIEMLSEQKFRLVNQLDNLATEYSSSKDNFKSERVELNEKIEKLETELTCASESVTKLQQTNTSVQKEVDVLQQRNVEQENALKTLGDRLMQQQMSFEEHQKGAQLIKEKHEKLLVQCEQLKHGRRESDDHLESMRSQLSIKENEMERIGLEISKVRKLNVELEERIDDMIKKYNMEKQASDDTINNRDAHINQINDKCTQLQMALYEAKTMNQKIVTELQTARNQSRIMFELFQIVDDNIESEKDSTIDLAKIIDKIKELQNLYGDANNKANTLKSQNDELHENLVRCEQQLECARLEYEKRAQCLYNDHQNAINVHTKTQSLLENELKLARDRLITKEQELSDAIRQHNNAQQQLKSTLQQLDKIENVFVEGMLNIKEKTETYLKVNSKFICADNINEQLKSVPVKHLMKFESTTLSSIISILNIVMQESSKALKESNDIAVKHAQNLDSINESYMQLQADLAAKDTELRIALDEQQQERDEWQSKFSQIMRNLTEQSIAQESYELAVNDIVNVIENNLCMEPKNCHQKQMFDNAAIKNDCLPLQRLRQVLNRVIARQRQIDDENHNFEKELQYKRTELKELQEAMTSETSSLENQLNQEVKRVNNELLALTGVNQKLGEENGTLQLHITELEKQLKEIKHAQQADMQTQVEKQQKLITLQAQHAQCDLKLQERASQLEQVRSQLNEQHTAMSELQNTVLSLQECEIKYQNLYSDHKGVEEERQRFKVELATLKMERARIENELKEAKWELQRSNENVSQLIQQIGSIRLEKEAVIEERDKLRSELNESGRTQSVCETRIKGIVERSQSLERHLQNAECEVKSMRAQLIINEQSNERLAADNEKLLESQKSSAQHIEELKHKINDEQACQKKLTCELAAKAATIHEMQCAHERLRKERESFENKLSNVERAHENCAIQQLALKQTNAELEAMRQKREASELDAKSKLSKLEKAREINEDKLRKLNIALTNSEATNVKLNLEIGALNSQLQETRSEISVERSKRDERELEFSSLTAKLQKEQQETIDNLTATANELKITQQKCDKLVEELQLLKSEILIVRAEKAHVEETTAAKLAEFEVDCKSQADLRARITELEANIVAKDEQINKLLRDIEDLRTECDKRQINANENKSCVKCCEFEGVRTRLNLAEVMLDKEQQLTAQLRLDNQILQAKYRESKQRLMDETKSSEERIKENRLELEGKLEKMKNKMKTLYTEEITKIKTKNEREVVNLKSEIEVLKSQNTKYEEYTRKLSSQIVRLNDQILEQQKQNAILSTNLKHVKDDAQSRSHIRRDVHASTKHATLPTSRPSSNALEKAASTNLRGTNMNMEDEEGEVFNNTYLADLMLGHMPDHIGRDVCVEELQYRNSLLPPHLKSTYTAQYDYTAPEDDVKDGGMNTLDDSMSALLATTGIGATRKKVSGATHYKRPGPPTPSKNGRLSFGGSNDPPREILKETYDGSYNTGVSVSSAKTPARFGFFASRFSLGGNNGGNNIGCVGSIKDENTPPKRRLSSMFKRK